jgi:hypothetical protein
MTLAGLSDLRSRFGNHRLVADWTFRLSLQRPLLQDTKIIDERLPTASLIIISGNY